MAARAPETLDPASAWLSSQDAESMWRHIGQQATLPPNGQAQQGPPPRAINTWAQSAEDAWVNIGRAPTTPPQLPAPSEYPDTINPLAIVKAGNQAWNHLSDSHPWSATARAKTAKLDSQGKPEMSAGTAAWQLIKAGALEAGFLGLPKASKVQNNILTAAEKLINKTGLKIDLEIPSTEIIAEEVHRIQNLYNAISPELVNKNGAGTELDQSIVAQAIESVSTLRQGHLDKAYPATDEELTLATQLLHLESLHKSPTEIEAALNAAVLSAAGDIAEQAQGNRLFSNYEHIGRSLSELAKETEPKKLFIVDYATSEIVLTKEEQKTHENRTWGLTPTDLVIRNISGEIDNFPIPLSKLITDRNNVPDGVLMVSGTPNAVDVLRRKGGRLLQSAGFRFGQQFGGTIQFISLERDRKIAEIVVMNPQGTMNLFAELADTIRNTHQILLDSQGRIRKQESGMRTKYIRPNIVMAELEKMTAPNKLVATAITRQSILKDLGDIFNREKAAGQAELQNGMLVFNNPRIRRITEKLADRLSETLKVEEKYRTILGRPQLPPPRT
ncbi:hypothetical protein KBD75_02390 [Candidatus Woesebacteria bacterium]|nr:hypothetical protein [Candidatus Woesebacteria bacterium]